MRPMLEGISRYGWLLVLPLLFMVILSGCGVMESPTYAVEVATAESASLWSLGSFAPLATTPLSPSPLFSSGSPTGAPRFENSIPSTPSISGLEPRQSGSPYAIPTQSPDGLYTPNLNEYNVSTFADGSQVVCENGVCRIVNSSSGGGGEVSEGGPVRRGLGRIRSFLGRVFGGRRGCRGC